MLSRSWARATKQCKHGLAQNARRLQIQGAPMGPSHHRSIHHSSLRHMGRRTTLRWTQEERQSVLYGPSTSIRLMAPAAAVNPSLFDIAVTTPWTGLGRSFVSYSIPTQADASKSSDTEGKEGSEQQTAGGRESGQGQEDQYKKEEAQNEDQENIPFIGMVGMGLKAIFRISVFGAIFALVCYCGYYVLRMIIPSSSSPLSVRNDAAKVLEANPDVNSQFGDISRVRGVDLGGRGEGRRNYVPSYTYELDGRKFTRVKFEVENERKQHAVVFAEVAHDRSRSSDFNYLMLQTSTGKVITIEDNRKPEKPKDLRKYDVSIKLQDDFARFYHGGPDHTASRQQEQILSPHFDYVKQIRCDRDEARCEADGVEPGTLVYKNKQLKAPKSLEELEKETGLSRYTRPGGVSYQDSIE